MVAGLQLLFVVDIKICQSPDGKNVYLIFNIYENPIVDVPLLRIIVQYPIENLGFPFKPTQPQSKIYIEYNILRERDDFDILQWVHGFIIVIFHILEEFYLFPIIVVHYNRIEGQFVLIHGVNLDLDMIYQ